MQEHPEKVRELDRVAAERSGSNWIEVDGVRMSIQAYELDRNIMGNFKVRMAQLAARIRAVNERK